jgi:hypothetical protein
MRIIACFAAFSLLATPALAQHEQHEQMPYAGMESREIKALSAEETQALLSGEGMGMALAAELNGYPGPKHVLELKEELSLSSDQETETQAVFERMRAEAISLGEEIVAREREVDELFAGQDKMTPSGLEAVMNEIARLKGELRYTHLLAHLEVRQILTTEQVEKYGQLRGYGHH